VSKTSLLQIFNARQHMQSARYAVCRHIGPSCLSNFLGILRDFADLGGNNG